MRALLVISFCTLCCFCFAQQEFAKQVVKELTARQLHGRGYTNSGVQLSADYLQKKYQQFGLQSFGNNFAQEFNINANTFPEKCGVQINGEKLIPGKDFLPAPQCGSASGLFQLTWLDKTNLQSLPRKIEIQNLPIEALVIDPGGTKNLDSLRAFRELKSYFARFFPVLWVTDEKLTHSVSQTQQLHPVINVKRAFIDNAFEVKLDISAVLIEGLKTQNIVGYIPGKKKQKICISAHYDHLGEIADSVLFPGANDNASGVAMLLYLMKYYTDHPPEYTMVFMAFAAEEIGILGSKYYVENPLFPLDEIKFLINCDISGTGDKGITVVNGTLHKKQFKKLAKINVKNQHLSKVNVRGRAANSDHYWFTQRQVPCFFIYTLGGIKAYHDIYDRGETLPLTAFNGYSRLLIDFICSF